MRLLVKFEFDPQGEEGQLALTYQLVKVTEQQRKFRGLWVLDDRLPWAERSGRAR
jgi:hypothetical protein